MPRPGTRKNILHCASLCWNYDTTHPSRRLAGRRSQSPQVCSFTPTAPLTAPPSPGVGGSGGRESGVKGLVCGHLSPRLSPCPSDHPGVNRP